MPRKPSMTRSRRASSVPVFAVALVLGLSACGGGSSGSTGEWVPQQDFQANAQPEPQLPQQNLPAPQPSAPGNAVPQPSTPNSAAPESPSSPGASSGAPAADPAVVATKLDQPVGLVVLPDGTALVGERSTGRIYRVQPVAGKPVTLVQTLSGVDAAGDGGLLDLALSPTFTQDGLVYAYLSTAGDNRVVAFVPGSAASPVVTGIPHGTTGNVGRIAFDRTGALLIATGDAGSAAAAADPTSLAGKVLRASDIGKPAADNPDPRSFVYARGVRDVTGLCVDPDDGHRTVVTAGPTGHAFTVTAGGSYVDPTGALPASARGVGGCALAGGRIYVATSTSKAIASATISATGALGTLSLVLNGKYGRLRTVVAGSDGALWITTTNRDGIGKPVPTDDRVIRIPVSAASGSSPL